LHDSTVVKTDMTVKVENYTKISFGFNDEWVKIDKKYILDKIKPILASRNSYVASDKINIASNILSEEFYITSLFCKKNI